MSKIKPAKKRPTSQDVADLAGVSIATVSLVINNKSGGKVRISEETRQKVRTAVETLNYRPFGAAQALATKRSNLLALMVPFIESPFLPWFVAAIQREAAEVGLGVIIYGSRNERQREQEFVNDCLGRGVDGIIAQTHQLTAAELEVLVEAGIAVIVYGPTPTHALADNVMFDEVEASARLVSTLIKKGYRRIATIAGPQDRWSGRLRYEGYVQALNMYGLPLEAPLICQAPSFARGAGAACMQTLLALPDPPDAVFAANDALAVDGMLVAFDAGLSVPGDVAFAGFDGTPESVMIRPRLTTVYKDIDLLGTTLVQMLLERLHSDEVLPARQKTLAYEIKIRESS